MQVRMGFFSATDRGVVRTAQADEPTEEQQLLEEALVVSAHQLAVDLLHRFE